MHKTSYNLERREYMLKNYNEMQ